MGHTALKKYSTEILHLPEYVYPSISRNNVLAVQLLEQLKKDHEATDGQTEH